MNIPSNEDFVSILNAKNSEIISLMNESNSLRTDNIITYSKNVFLPLTEVCRNNCGYCTFRKDPSSENTRILMQPDKVMNIVEKGNLYKCREALFTFGEYPEDNELVKIALEELGYNSILEYLYFLCDETLDKTGLLPHSNPGILNKNELRMLRGVNASMGLMLETTSERLMKTIAHEKSPGKHPELRIKTIKNAGKLKIPFTTGLLIGIGETIQERVESLLELRRIRISTGIYRKL